MITQEQKMRFKKESAALVVLALPLIANNIMIGLMTFIDFVMAGKISALDLAAVGVANTVWAFVFLAGLGVMMAVNPIAAQLEGAGQFEQIGQSGRQAIWLSLFIAIAIFIFLQRGSDDVMTMVGIREELIPIAYGYLKALSFGCFAMFSFLALRYISEGISHTKPIMIVALVSLVVNASGNYVLMFGKFGAPRLGAIGCGYATAIAMWVSLLAMVLYVIKTPAVYDKLRLFERFEWPSWERIKAILALGVPISGSVTAEVGLFSAAGLIMGTLSANEAAAHSVAINYASTMFMVPLALHSAIMIRVGRAVGASNADAARYCGWVGIVLCGVFMTFSAVVLMIFRDPITTLYVNDQEVRVIASQLLLMAMIFQIADGVQVGAAGAVRGYKDTTIPFVINVIAFWFIGFPIAVLAGTQLGYRGEGVWAGLAAGLVVASILLCWRFNRISRLEIKS